MSGTALRYLTRGSGAPLVLLPGLAGRTGAPARFLDWIDRQQIVELSAQRKVWNILPPTGLAAGTSIADVATQYALTLSELFDEPVDVVGVSTGASVALQLTADHPELVRRLVVVSGGHRLGSSGRTTQREIATHLRANRPRRAASTFLGNTGASAPSRAALQLAGMIAPRLIVGHRDDDLLVMLDAEDAFDLTDRLESISAPMLIAGGRHDRFYTAAVFEQTHAAVPNAELQIYPRGGHIGVVGNRVLARRILRFLDAPFDGESAV